MAALAAVLAAAVGHVRVLRAHPHRPLRRGVRQRRHPRRERRGPPGGVGLLLVGRLADGERGRGEPAERHAGRDIRLPGERGDRGREREFLQRLRCLPEGNRPRRRLHRDRRGDPGRLDHHPAVREEHPSLAGTDGHPQGPRIRDRAEAEQSEVQAGDSAGLSQHQLVRAWFVRHSGSRVHVLRNPRLETRPQPVGPARGPAQGRRGVRSGAQRGQSQAGRGALGVDSGPAGRNGRPEQGETRPVPHLPRAEEARQADQPGGPDRLSPRHRQQIHQGANRPHRQGNRPRRLPHSHDLRQEEGPGTDEGRRAGPQEEHRPEEAGQDRYVRGSGRRIGTPRGRGRRRRVRRFRRGQALHQQRGHVRGAGGFGVQALRAGSGSGPPGPEARRLPPCRSGTHSCRPWI